MQSQTSFPGKPKLFDQLRTFMGGRQYSLRTEEAYLDWIRRFILFHGKRHRRDLGERDISAFLSGLAVEGKVAASTQNQALSALLFLYKEVLGRELAFIGGVVRVKRPPKLPVVVSPTEVRAVLAQLTGQYRLMAELLYGSGQNLQNAVKSAVRAARLNKGDSCHTFRWKG